MLHIGAILERPPGPKYTATLRFAELAPRAPLPRPSTLAKVRAAAPPDFVFALRAPRSSMVSSRGALRFDDQLEGALQWLVNATEALQAKAVVFNTPAELTPGARSRELFAEYVRRLPVVENRHYVWLPQGLWEPSDAQTLCGELGLCYGFDPLEARAVRASNAVYATLRALGHRASFSPAALSDALATTLQHQPQTVFMCVDAERGFDVARRLQALATDADPLADDDDAAVADGDVADVADVADDGADYESDYEDSSDAP